MKTYQDLKNELRNEFEKGNLLPLTLEAAKQLRGKKIETIYFSWSKSQDGVDSFNVGEIVSEWELAGRKFVEEFGTTRQENWAAWMSEEQITDNKEKLTILTEEGKETYIYLFMDRYNNVGVELEQQTFSCSDADRTVYYRVVE